MKCELLITQIPLSQTNGTHHRQITDPLDNTYQGYHFYFNTWSVAGDISQMTPTLSKGIKIINIEIGVDCNEYISFSTAAGSELNMFLAQCASLGIGNTIWMNKNLNNWPCYRELGLSFLV
jgi:hypothetical protein